MYDEGEGRPVFSLSVGYIISRETAVRLGHALANTTLSNPALLKNEHHCPPQGTLSIDHPISNL